MTDETVLVVHSPQGGRKEFYHTNSACERIDGSSTVEWDRDDADDWGMTECSFCAGEIDNTDQDHSTFHALLEYGKQRGGGSA